MITIDIILPKNRGVPILKNAPALGMRLDSNWYPVFLNRAKLKSMGYQVKFHNYSTVSLEKLADTVIVDYQVGKNLTNMAQSHESRNEALAQFLQKIAKKGKKIILFDTKDGTNIQYNLLPHVDLYCKKQLLKDRALYRQPLIGDRLYTDYYAKTYQLNTKDYPEFEEPTNAEFDLYATNQDKLALAWNLLLAINQFSSNLAFVKFWLQQNIKIHYTSPDTPKPIMLNANFRTNYEAALISFQRQELDRIVRVLQNSELISYGLIPKAQYLAKMVESKAILSPFGWGEVCYRDYEAFTAGAALIKPAMEHLETWPNVYLPNKTYFPLDWKVETWGLILGKLLSDVKQMKFIAKQGQDVFQGLWSEQGQQEFCEHFLDLVGMVAKD
jgi:hypothetical protein